MGSAKQLAGASLYLSAWVLVPFVHPHVDFAEKGLSAHKARMALPAKIYASQTVAFSGFT